MIINNLNFPITVLKETNILNLELLNDELTSKKLETISILGSDDVFLVFSLEDEKFLKSGIFNINILPSDTYNITFRFKPQDEKFYIRKTILHFEDGDISVNISGRGYDNSYKKDPIKIVFNKELSNTNINIREDMGDFLIGNGFIDETNSKIYWFYPENKLKDNTTYIGRVEKIGTESKDDFRLKNSYEWKFSTGVVNFPYILFREPKPNSIDFPVSSPIIVEFSEEMRPGTISMKLFDEFNIEVLGTIEPFGIFTGIVVPNGSVKPNKKGDLYWKKNSNDLYESKSNSMNSWILVNNIKGITKYAFIPSSMKGEMIHTVFVYSTCRAIRTSIEYSLGVPLNSDYVWTFRTGIANLGPNLITNDGYYIITNEESKIKLTLREEI